MFNCIIIIIIHFAYSESAFSVITPKNWNSLSYDIRCIHCYNITFTV